MGFLDNLFNNDDKKKKAGSGSGNNDNNNNNNNNPLANFRRNIEKIGKPSNSFQGAGQSLGGSKPGAVIDMVLVEQGPLGIHIEKNTGNAASAIVGSVVPGTQAERAGLKRGDVLCFAGSNGQDEIPYEMFLDMARSGQRPIHLEARRFESKPLAKPSVSADAETRRRAMIAAAEAREKKHKSQTKTIKHVTKSTLLKQQQQEQQAPLTEEQLRPQTEASRQAIEAAKRGEADLTAALGYNPYEVVKKTAGQARSATTATQHGSIQAAPGSGNANASGGAIPAVAPPANPTSALDDVAELPTDFREALAEVVAFGDAEAAKNGLKIARTLAKNATTKGQQTGDAEKAEKFRKVRLANPKIRAAIVDVPGNLHMLLAIGFQLTEDAATNESLLVFPPFHNGPDWLPRALRAMEDREQAL